MNDYDREQQYKLRKLEAINAELARHKRRARFVLLLVVGFADLEAVDRADLEKS